MELSSKISKTLQENNSRKLKANDEEIPQEFEHPNAKEGMSRFDNPRYRWTEHNCEFAIRHTPFSKE